MAPSKRDIGFCLVSVALGGYCLTMDPSGCLEHIGPLVESCSSGLTPEEHASTNGFHIYNPTLGLGVWKVLVCVFSHFAYELTQNSPAGVVTWMTTIFVWLPLGVLMTIEAGRKDAKGPVRYPMIVGVLFQMIGISIVFPLVWVPSWILGRGTGGANATRIKAAVPVHNFSLLILSVLVLTLNPATNLWTNLACMLGGPLLSSPYAFYWVIPDPDPKDPRILKQSNEWSSFAFAGSGVLALLGWMWLLLVIAIPHYGFSASAIYKDIWTEAATPVIKFMTMDGGVLWLSGLIVLGYHNIQAALEGMALSLFFGPGAGLALVLAGLSVDDDAQLKLAEKTVQAKKESQAKEKLGKKD